MVPVVVAARDVPQGRSHRPHGGYRRAVGGGYAARGSYTTVDAWSATCPPATCSKGDALVPDRLTREQEPARRK
jgi:hypothetical protein